VTTEVPPRPRPGDLAVPAVGIATAVLTASCVGWATVRAPAAAPPPPPVAVRPDTTAVARELAALDTALVAVRRDVARLNTLHLSVAVPKASGPRAATTTVTAGAAAAPPPPLPPAPVVQAAPPPPAHTSTGASGVPH
jgi:pilus assembly protein FimV